MKLLRDTKGSVILLVPVLLIVLLTIFASVCEHSRLNSVAANTNDAVQAALTQVCTDNTTPVYTGVRDGYSGGYKLESTNWTPDVSSSDILSKVDAKLGTSGGVKTSDGKLIYKISDLSVTMKNAPLAPSDPDSAEQLTGTATYTLTVPLSFGWSSLPPMTIHMEAKSGYSQQGDLRGSDDFGDDSGTQVTGVSLSESAMTLCKGDTDVLAASVLPDDAEDRSISWASANSAVCSVTQTGVITGVDKGSTTVMAISDSGKMAQCDVTVITPVTGVTLDKTSVSMIPGATESLTATVLPSDADNDGVSWVSSDPSVCTVDSSGKVTAVGEGQSTITVMTQEGGYYAECVVKVTIPVTGITLDKTALTIAKGATDTLTASVWPGNATRQDVLWASSDSSVCTVDQSGNIVAVGVGSAVISATTEDGQYVATCTINVVIPVTGVSVSPTVLELIKETTGTVTATVSPSDATDKTVFWNSSDSNIASVDSSGKISANNVGKATITGRTEDGGYTATCDVTVVIPVTGVSLDQTELQIIKGNIAKLTVIIIPSDATDKAVTWSTSNTDVAAVDQSGNVTAVDGGTATITVRTHDGGYTASCKVSVFVPVTGVSVDPTTLTLHMGDTSQLTATTTPSNATDKSVTWSTSNLSVCTVDSSGKVAAVGAGSATVTVTTNNGYFQASCGVIVKSSIRVRIDNVRNCGSGGQFNLDGSGTIDLRDWWYSDGKINVYANYYFDLDSPITFSASNTIMSFALPTHPTDHLHSDQYVNFYIYDDANTKIGYGAYDAYTYPKTLTIKALTPGTVSSFHLQVSTHLRAINNSDAYFNMTWASGGMSILGTPVTSIG